MPNEERISKLPPPPPGHRWSVCADDPVLLDEKDDYVGWINTISRDTPDEKRNTYVMGLESTDEGSGEAQMSEYDAACYLVQRILLGV